MGKFQMPRVLTERELNTIRGKALIGHASIDEIMQVFGHIDSIELKLDEWEIFGDTDWREVLGITEHGEGT